MILTVMLVGIPVGETWAQSGADYVIRQEQWTDADEREFGEFVTGIGESGCRTVDSCWHGPGNPFRSGDPEGLLFRSDCADLPYLLRFYFAWKKGLPFSFQSAMQPRGKSRDIRFSNDGNRVAARTGLLTGAGSGYAIMERLHDTISTASYRVHPELDTPYLADFYSPRLDPHAIRPGTVFYDPTGHVGIVYKVEPSGRILYIDAHPDQTLTRGVYDTRFARAAPAIGAGFKNWRPQKLVGATKAEDGILRGGRYVLTPDSALPDFSVEQFYGNGEKPSDANWPNGQFMLDGQTIGYYDYVRAQVAGGKLSFDPVREIADMTDSICTDLDYRREAVDLAIKDGLSKRPQPVRLPANIYGTNGDWEFYSTPSRDARLKTAFKELRDTAARFVAMYWSADSRLAYPGGKFFDDLIAAHEKHAAACNITYRRSDGSSMTLSYDEMRKRLFAMSFDPYHCPERRWGAEDPAELATCPDDARKKAWYAAEQSLRNQLDRSYDAQMGFDLAELQQPGANRGEGSAPDVDLRAYLLAEKDRYK